MANVKITHLEDSYANILSGKRVGLIAFATDDKLLRYFDASLAEYRFLALNTDNTPLSSIGSIQLNDESIISNSDCSISFLSTGIEISDNAIALIKRDRENE